ncbi:MAG: DUF4493 domain-containing protein [Muribaculaceae bacterium]|nr:DUF4493 domain-containing protein [Muribaculaceae bacterium]
MKKKIYQYSAIALLAVTIAACSEEQINIGGEGKLVLKTSLSTDMTVVSRTVEQDLIDNCMVWISNEKGLIRRYDKYNDVPTEPISLLSGHYVAEAWTGDSVPASFEKRWFKGREEFDIESSDTKTVNLECKIANVAATVSYADGMENVLHDFSMTIGHKGGSLIYSGREERRGYFMMPSFDKNLAYELRGTQLDGKEFVYNGVIEDAQPGTEYALKVTFTPVSNEVGGAIFSITIDNTTIEKGVDLQVIAAPKISGYGFSIDTPLMTEKGTVGKRTIYVSSATKVNSVILRSDIFNSMTILGGNEFDLLKMNEAGLKVINEAGINHQNNYNEENDETLIKINFEEPFTNTLDNGNYSIEIVATDQYGKTSTCDWRLLISDALVMTSPMPEDGAVSHFSATLYGTVTKDGVENIGFKYRRVGTEEWSTVEGVAMSRSYAVGTEYTATVTGLEDGAEYEYVATSDDYESTITQRFTTLRCIQLPNSSFEDWCTEGKALVPGTSYATTFWDSGNHGSTTLSINVTENSTDYAHDGQYSARLKSQYVGVGGSLGKFAAGNIFAGNYLRTVGTTGGELGWGRPFAAKPKSVQLWVKYIPKTVQSGSKSGDGNYMPAGSLDQGIIYAALVDDTKQKYTQSGNNFNGTEWPCIVRTASAELFDKDGANVIAYGEQIFMEATEGEGLILIEIPFKYKSAKTPSNIIFVASASRYGDYFQGGEGSTMYIDDIKMIYE